MEPGIRNEDFVLDAVHAGFPVCSQSAWVELRFVCRLDLVNNGSCYLLNWWSAQPSHCWEGGVLLTSVQYVSPSQVTAVRGGSPHICTVR